MTKNGGSVDGQSRKDRRAIQGYEGIYEVTSTGRIFTSRENRALARCKYN